MKLTILRFKQNFLISSLLNGLILLEGHFVDLCLRKIIHRDRVSFWIDLIFWQTVQCFIHQKSANVNTHDAYAAERSHTISKSSDQCKRGKDSLLNISKLPIQLCYISDPMLMRPAILTTHKMHLRVNQHRANVRRGFTHYCLCRHCSQKHIWDPHVFLVTLIDFIPAFIHIRFADLTIRDIFWL